MKKLVLSLLALLVAAGTILAQDVESKIKDAEDLSKDADKALGSFNLNPNENKAKLVEANGYVADVEKLVGDLDKAALTAALGDEDDVEDAMKDLSKVWHRVGDVYNEIANQVVAVKQLNMGSLEELPPVKQPALRAANAYKMALAMAIKKYQRKDAIAGLEAVQRNLNNMAIFGFEDKEYNIAYMNFNETLVTHELLSNNGGASLLADEGQINDQKYYAGLAALSGGMVDKAAPLFEELYKISYDNPQIYEGLYLANKPTGTPEDEGFEAGMDKAYEYLKAGREKYPEDVSLLFSEINHYLTTGKLSELIGKLKKAIEKEPDNKTLYSTLGNVFDNLYQREAEAGNDAKAQEYFDSALDYYNQATEKDPNFVDAIYSIGALYYNKAASMTAELNKLAEDYSKEGLKKYDAKKAEIFEQFDQALPWFKKAESLDPNDINTLIALKEIFARKDDLDTSKEMANRLDNVKGGGKNESSYFNE
jgi:tetratricopeptide (TPR) repeat protein